MRRRSHLARRAQLGAGALAIVAVASCSLFLPLSEYDRDTDLATTDGGGDVVVPDVTAPDASDDGVAPCTLPGDNCGECGRSCAGEACTDGVCGTKHAFGTIAVLTLTVSETAVYAGSGIVVSDLIAKLPLDLATTVTPPLYAAQGAPTAMTIAGDRLVWGDLPGAVSSIDLDLDASSARVVSEAGAPFVAQLAGLFGPVWTSPDPSDGGVFGTAGPLVSAPGAWGLAIVDQEIFFGVRKQGGSIVVRRLAGDEVLVPDAGIPVGVAVDAQAVYWADCLSGTIRRFDRQTRAVSTLADTQQFPFAVAVSGEHVYWTTLGVASGATECVALYPTTTSANGSVVRVRRDGSGRPLVLARDQELPLALAIRDGQSYVYWSSGSISPKSGIWRTAR